MSNDLMTEAASCRACDAPLHSPILSLTPPAISSIARLHPVPVSVSLCAACGHLNSPGIPDALDYFDTEYQFSLESDDHDQIYDVIDGRPRFRTAYQSELVERSCALCDGAKVLDYGAGKATTLRMLLDRRPDIEGHVFDVSRDYQTAWNTWLAPERQATYELPENWGRRFDVVMSLFAFHCIPDPVRAFADIARVLKPGGQFFMLVPDVLTNPADMIVAEHVNHFTPSSIRASLARAGMSAERIDRSAFRGAFLVVARLDESTGTRASRTGRSTAADAAARSIAKFWSGSGTLLADKVAALADRRVAIYGAGVYGTFIASRIRHLCEIVCFVDRNPHLTGTQHLGVPVVAPDNFPTSIDTVFAGLNPVLAHQAISDWQTTIRRPDLRVVYLDAAPDIAIDDM
ncbi:MAG: class I SAM-dependent methyltransferase [Hyphomicrobiaceae bacterium]